MNATASPTLRPEHPGARPVSALATRFGLEVDGALEGVEVTGVSLSSGAVEPGDLYVAVPGRNAHGAAYSAAARESGAVAILTDPSGAERAAASGLPVLITPDPRAALGEVAAWIYRTDELDATVFGVTGTNGKTSVVHLLCAILTQLGVVSGLSSTAERRIGRTAVVSSLTTPEASELHGLLARMREEAVRAVAVEVSAQALSRHRVDGIVFDVAGFTNLSHDHLDDYGDMEEYFQAKLALFQPDRARRGVVIVDSDWGRRIVDESRIPVTTITGQPGGDAQWSVTLEEEDLAGSVFTLRGPDGRGLTARVPVPGGYMTDNAALAIVMLVESGFDLDAIAHALERDGGIRVYIPGRLERVSGATGPTVFVDYGHTPDAFLATLASLRRVTPGRIVMVFGADGDRDATKRADMGAIAARGSDALIITDFHPRSEDPAVIRSALMEGARHAVPDLELYEIPDVHQAVRHALTLVGEGDVLLYAGPGHEDYREVAGVKVPYSAREDTRLALREAGWTE